MWSSFFCQWLKLVCVLRFINIFVLFAVILCHLVVSIFHYVEKFHEFSKQVQDLIDPDEKQLVIFANMLVFNASAQF